MKQWLLEKWAKFVLYLTIARSRWDLILISGLLAFAAPVGIGIKFTKFLPTDPHIYTISIFALIIGALTMSLPSGRKETPDTIWTAILWGLTIGSVLSIFVVFHP